LGRGRVAYTLDCADSFLPEIFPYQRGDLDPIVYVVAWAHLTHQPERHFDRVSGPTDRTTAELDRYIRDTAYKRRGTELTALKGYQLTVDTRTF